MALQLPIQRDAAPLRTQITVEQALQQLEHLRQLVQSYLDKDIDYGKMPGTNKDTLFKSGAEKLCEIYGFYPDYEIHSFTENWDREPNLFDYTIKCVVKSRNDGSVVCAGLGSCNSYESKYRWRRGQRQCPDCGATAIKPSKAEYGAGYYCDRKDAGCGTSFQREPTNRRAPTDAEIVAVHGIDHQSVDRVENRDLADVKNTVLKMAKKRALIDAVISATRSSGIFSQDLEDFVDAVIIKPVTISESDIKGLIQAARDKGFAKDAVLKHMKQLETNGASRTESYTAAKKFFTEDEHNDNDSQFPATAE